MIDPDLTAIVSGSAPRFQDIEIGEREPMVLVVVSQKCESRVLVNDLRFEDIAVPCEHLIEAARLVDDMGEFHRLYHRCLPLDHA